jgi:alkyl hydroperoxide reductase subunit AhpC
VLVGKKAPNFTAKAFHRGKITTVTLENLQRQWVVLCFYPGDFTFV